MNNDEWKWPEPPTTPRDVIAGHFRNWGRQSAYGAADTLIIELAVRGFHVAKSINDPVTP